MRSFCFLSLLLLVTTALSAQIPDSTVLLRRAHLAEYTLMDHMRLEGESLYSRNSDNLINTLPAGLRFIVVGDLVALFTEPNPGAWLPAMRSTPRYLDLQIDGIGVPDVDIGCSFEYGFCDNIVPQSDPYSYNYLTSADDGIVTRHRLLPSLSAGAKIILPDIISLGYTYKDVKYLHSYIDAGTEHEYTTPTSQIHSVSLNVDLKFLSGIEGYSEFMEKIDSSKNKNNTANPQSIGGSLEFKDNNIDMNIALRTGLRIVPLIGVSYNGVFDVISYDILLGWEDFVFLQCRFVSVEPSFSMLEANLNLYNIFDYIFSEDDYYKYNSLDDFLKNKGKMYRNYGIGCRFTYFQPISLRTLEEQNDKWSIFVNYLMLANLGITGGCINIEAGYNYPYSDIAILNTTNTMGFWEHIYLKLSLRSFFDFGRSIYESYNESK